MGHAIKHRAAVVLATLRVFCPSVAPGWPVVGSIVDLVLVWPFAVVGFDFP